MSLRMQVEKKKAHEEMRRLMAERKKQDSKPMLVDNPLAKYNKSGQLTCVLCSSIVKSEKVWQVHINSRQHKENIEQAKKLKELTNNFTLGKIKQKRSGAVHNDGPEQKKIKGILKNTSLQTSIAPLMNEVPNVVLHHNEEVIRTPNNPTLKSNDLLNQPNSTKDVDLSVAPDQPIPEGFFDDPILDAKVRNIEYKDPVEEEWEKFQKEIKEEASASAEIIAGEQEEATAERQIDEIDEQLRNWSRVLDLELKKEDTKKKMQDLDQMSGSEDDDTDHDANIDEFLDWRAKNSYA